MTTKQADGERGFTGACWCGERNAWFSTTYLERSCAGTRMLQCDCGGDFCVCHNHGEIECDGCEDCEYDDDEWPDDDA